MVGRICGTDAFWNGMEWKREEVMDGVMFVSDDE